MSNDIFCFAVATEASDGVGYYVIVISFGNLVLCFIFWALLHSWWSAREAAASGHWASARR